MTVEIFDPRTLGKSVYEALVDLRQEYDDALKDEKINSKLHKDHLKEQKNQAVELYTYLSTWGLMRLKAEEFALRPKPDKYPKNLKEKTETSQFGKLEVVRKYFACLQKLSGEEEIAGDRGLENLKKLDTEPYLGLTGLGLALSQEFSFWATAVYHDISGED